MIQVQSEQVRFIPGETHGQPELMHQDLKAELYALLPIVLKQLISQ